MPIVRRASFVALLPLLLLLPACVVRPAPTDWPIESSPPANEHYRLSMLLPGDGALLPFYVSVPSQGRTGVGYYISGDHRAPAQFRRDADRFFLFIPHYDSRLTVEYDAKANSATGTWKRGDSLSRNIVGRRLTQIEFDNRRRFDKWPGAEQYTAPRPGGNWFASMDGRVDPVTIYLNEADGQSVRGSFIYTTGDSGPMTGQRYGDQIRLAIFDGARAALAEITLADDGDSLRGCLRNAYSPRKRNFTATRTSTTALAHDPLDEVHMRGGESYIHHPALDDPALEDRPIILSVIGTSCPNSNDAAEILVDLQERYRDTDLALVSLAFEEAPSARAAAPSIASFKARHDIDWPVAYAGVDDKKISAEQLATLDAFKSYPTVIFINRDRTVEAIHSGFAGPGTGYAHNTLRATFDELTRTILESEPQ